MEFNEERVLVSLRGMEDSDAQESVENSHSITRLHTCYQPCPNPSLSWLDLRVFCVRITKCVISDGSTLECLKLNLVPLERDSLLEANGLRAALYSDGISVLLKRVRLDGKSEEAAFVCTDSIRMTRSVKFEVFDGDILVLSGTLGLSQGNGSFELFRNQGTSWRMTCDSDFTRFFKGNRDHCKRLESGIEVYVAGRYSGSPVVFSRSLHVSPKRKQLRKGMLESIPEREAIESQKCESSSLAIQSKHHKAYKPKEENHCSSYYGMEYLEGEEDDRGFNAGVRVGIGIGLSICFGVGMGVGLLLRTYQGTTRNFRRHLL